MATFIVRNWNIIIGVPEEEDKKKDHEKILEIIVENFPKMGKEIITQVQETQRVPNRINHNLKVSPIFPKVCRLPWMTLF